MEGKEKEVLKEELIKEIAKNATVFKGGKFSNEIIIREGKAKEVFNPEPINVSGTIDAPARWVESKRWLNPKAIKDITDDMANTIVCNQNETVVLVDREKMSIKLIDNHDSHFHHEITGVLQFSEEFKKFKINSGDYMSSFKMSEFFKMNRAHFISKGDCNDLVSVLRNFEATVESEIKASDDKRGNTKALQQQAVKSNLPESFKLNIPVFKGMPKQEIEVEVYIDASTLQCALVSAEAEEIKVTLRDNAIDSVIDRIKEVGEYFTIIEV